jgi:hypothetical protein
MARRIPISRRRASAPAPASALRDVWLHGDASTASATAAAERRGDRCRNCA